MIVSYIDGIYYNISFINIFNNGNFIKTNKSYKKI